MAPGLPTLHLKPALLQPVCYAMRPASAAMVKPQTHCPGPCGLSLPMRFSNRPSQRASFAGGTSRTQGLFVLPCQSHPRPTSGYGSLSALVPQAAYRILLWLHGLAQEELHLLPPRLLLFRHMHPNPPITALQSPSSIFDHALDPTSSIPAASINLPRYPGQHQHAFQPPNVMVVVTVVPTMRQPNSPPGRPQAAFLPITPPPTLHVQMLRNSLPHTPRKEPTTTIGLHLTPS